MHTPLKDRLNRLYEEADVKAREAGYDNDLDRIMHEQTGARKRVEDLLRFGAEFEFKYHGREYPATQLVKTLAQEGHR